MSASSSMCAHGTLVLAIAAGRLDELVHAPLLISERKRG